MINMSLALFLLDTGSKLIGYPLDLCGIGAIYEHLFRKPLPLGERLRLPMSLRLEEFFRVQGLPAD